MHWPASLEDIGIVNFVAAIAVLANIAGYLMKTMIPLRLIAIVTNFLFIAYSILATVYPTLVLHIILLPINVVRFVQMKRLIRQVNEAANGDLSMDWLKPFSTERRFEAGTVLFRKGDAATELHFVISGRCRVVEPNIEMGAGSVIGELGLLEPGRTRTATVECIESVETLAISYDSVMELYFQNPTFGFYLLQLSTARLFHTIRSLEEENAALHVANAKLSADSPA
ncbi:MAG: cyclic nucleotide-binding domain-containing protein [Hyphomicrobiales bacterium]